MKGNSTQYRAVNRKTRDSSADERPERNIALFC